MGLKGLYSVLSKEPNRFGSSWESNPLNAVDLYIDAPSLHHHLLSALKQHYLAQRHKERSPFNDTRHARNSHPIPPSFLFNSNGQNEDVLFAGLVSPRSVYHLTQAFLQDVRNAIHPDSHIYVVFDGVASPYKRKQQVERMVHAAAICDVAARDFVKGVFSKQYPVVHLLSEDAMKQAVLHLCQEQDGSDCDDTCHSLEKSLFRYHLAPGEAEGYIAKEIKNCRTRTSDIDRTEIHPQHSRKVLVLSSDTDFLVYPSVPGILPLQNFHFHYSQHPSEEGSCSNDRHNLPAQIHAWEYSRQKFLNAFPSLLQCNDSDNDNDNDDCFSIMVTVAALVGCDYHFEENNSKQHQFSLNTARQVIVKSDIGGLRQRDRNNPTAMATFIAVTRFVGHFVALSSRKSKNGSIGWRDHLVMAIGKESQRRDCERENQLLTEALIMISRIYEEDYSLDLVACTRGDACYENVDIKRVVMQNVFYCRPLVETSHKTSLDFSQKRMMKRSKKKKKTVSSGKSFASHGGIWMEDSFLNFRKGLFYFLLMKRETSSSTRGIPAVREYSRNIVGNKLDFDDLIKREIDFPVNDLERSLFGENCLEFDSFPPSTHHVLLISSFLSSKTDCLFLLLIMFNQGCSTSPNVGKERIQNMPGRQELLSTFNRIQVAIYHVHVYLGVNHSSVNVKVNKYISSYQADVFTWNRDIYQSWLTIVTLLNRCEGDDQIYEKVLNKVKPDKRQNALQVWYAWMKMSPKKKG